MPKTLRDYADALAAADLRVYTHVVLLEDGRQFSIHKSETDALEAAARLKVPATVEPFTPKPTAYWNGTIGERYDH